MFLVGPSRLFKKAALIRLKKYNNPIQTIPAKKWVQRNSNPNQSASPTDTPTIARYPIINTTASPNPTAIVCIGLSRNFIVSPHSVYGSCIGIAKLLSVLQAASDCQARDRSVIRSFIIGQQRE